MEFSGTLTLMIDFRPGIPVTLLDFSRSQKMISPVYDTLAQTTIWELEDKNPVCVCFHREARLPWRIIPRSIRFLYTGR